ncbi:hypothetical protein ANN_12625 [Periplaneta americana]|uniref:Uncharacterized protein n=1 Tax=Periplaneta americana TaxID=6978 RepID=A0ABQ8TJ95_PERAM|nr:hypothetical protein ANN_12625 [Periplaneta americana]
MVTTVRQKLNEMIGVHCVGQGESKSWPPWSPDLTPLDFFLWGFVKQHFLQREPTSIDDLKPRITHVIQYIPPATLLSVTKECQDRVRHRLEVNEGHFEHLRYIRRNVTNKLETTRKRDVTRKLLCERFKEKESIMLRYVSMLFSLERTSILQEVLSESAQVRLAGIGAASIPKLPCGDRRLQLSRGLVMTRKNNPIRVSGMGPVYEAICSDPNLPEKDAEENVRSHAIVGPSDLCPRKIIPSQPRSDGPTIKDKLPNDSLQKLVNTTDAAERAMMTKWKWGGGTWREWSTQDGRRRPPCGTHTSGEGTREDHDSALFVVRVLRILMSNYSIAQCTSPVKSSSNGDGGSGDSGGVGSAVVAMVVVVVVPVMVVVVVVMVVVL